PLDSAGTPVGYGRIPGLTGVTGGQNGVSARIGGPGSGGSSIWDTFANDVLGIGGDIAGGGPLGTIASVLYESEQKIAWFFVPSHWARIICFILGVPLVGIGIVTMTKGTQPVPVSAYGVSTEVSAGSI